MDRTLGTYTRIGYKGLTLYQTMTHVSYQGRLEPPKAARGHATSSSANIDSVVLNVTKNRDPCAACKTAHTVEVLTFFTLSLSTSMVRADLPITQCKEQRI